MTTGIIMIKKRDGSDSKEVVCAADCVARPEAIIRGMPGGVEGG